MYSAGYKAGPAYFRGTDGRGGLAPEGAARSLLDLVEVRDAARGVSNALAEMRRAFDTYDGKPGEGSYLPDMLLCREAAASSRIEGLDVGAETLHAALRGGCGAAGGDPHVMEALGAVLSYRRARESAGRGWPTSTLLRMAHSGLYGPLALSHPGRAARVNPGKYRDVQNWIGSPGAGIEGAVYVPPPPSEVQPLMTEIAARMDAWRGLGRGETGNSEGHESAHSAEMELLVDAAILHADFEGVHPFVDGNGRVGRLAVHLMLVLAGLYGRGTEEATPPLSEALESSRGQYYKLLNATREIPSVQTGIRPAAAAPYAEWTTFFLGCLQKATSRAMHIAQRGDARS